MKKLIFVVFLFLSFNLIAETYYIKTSGNDSNTGLSDSQAWATIGKVNGYAFAANDSILFKGGDTWISPGATSPYRLNVSVGNVYIGSYGTGQAEITAWIEIPNWTTSGNWSEYSTNVWRMSLTNFPNRLWLNGKDSYRCPTLSLTPTENWRWVSGYLYVYATSNPSSFYNSIKSGSEQSRTIGLSYPGITLDNINVVGGNTCILVSASNITIKNCTIGDKVNIGGIKILCETLGDSIDNVLIFNNRLITNDSITYNYLKDPHTTGDGIQIGNGVTNCKIYNNYLERWSHVGTYMYAPSSNYPFHGNEIYENYYISNVIDYCRAFCVDYHSGGYNNSIHDNTAIDMSIGNQLNGNGLKFYNNIIDGIRGTSYMTSGVSNGFGSSSYAVPATNMELYNNIVRNAHDYGISMNDYGFGNSGNNIHDNNIINSVGYQVYVYNIAGVNNNTYTNNHIYSESTVNTVYYNNTAMTVDQWNDFTTTNGDNISLNDTTLTFGSVTTTLNDMLILHNPTSSDTIISLNHKYKDLIGNILYSVEIPSYSSKVIFRDYSVSSIRPIMSEDKYYINKYGKKIRK